MKTKFVVPTEMESPVLVCGYQIAGGSYSEPRHVSRIDFAEVVNFGDALSVAEKYGPTGFMVISLHDLNEVARLLVTGAMQGFSSRGAKQQKRDVLNVASNHKKASRSGSEAR